ncbi:MAG: SprT-like domain-containing protein [Psychrobacillus sp.]
MRKFDVKTIEIQLKDMCEYFVQNAYGVELDIPVLINNRLKRSLGRFIEKAGKAYRIEFSGMLLTNGTEEQIMSVLKHECIHYALFKLGRNHRDGQEDFENELLKYGSHSTNSLHVKR